MVSLCLLGCTEPDTEGMVDPCDRPGPDDLGVLENSAAEVWPWRPDLPKLDNEEVVRACAAYVMCEESFADRTREGLLTALRIRVFDVVGSAEQAIPITDLLYSGLFAPGGLLAAYNERAEFFVSCVNSANQDCAAIRRCLSPRLNDLECDERGCRNASSQPFVRSCNGTVATLTKGSLRFQRDCARAFAECDPKSATGCTDRRVSGCRVSGSQRCGVASRCDGDVELGCDQYNRVTYNDCTRLGGWCGTDSLGFGSCMYPRSSECLLDPYFDLTCSGDKVNVCSLSVGAPELCNQQ
jgi:hypothetical protein